MNQERFNGWLARNESWGRFPRAGYRAEL